MTLTGLYPEPAARVSRRWVAVWRTPRGNFIHDVLPFAIRDVPRTDATAYAQAHQPEVTR
jgi:hypothetical protein